MSVRPDGCCSGLPGGGGGGIAVARVEVDPVQPRGVEQAEEGQHLGEGEQRFGGLPDSAVEGRVEWPLSLGALSLGPTSALQDQSPEKKVKK